MNETKNYHHGNLRQALIDAALEVVERDGYQALSLRELAQLLGVSRGAPYRHFADRDALLAACAMEGFRQLMAASQAMTEAVSDSMQRAHAMGTAFIAFAEAQPGLFMLMFDSGLLNQAQDNDELGELLRQTYEQVSETVAATLEVTDPTTLRLRMIGMWSTLYGYARLRQSRMLKPYMLEGVTAEDARQAVLDAAFGTTHTASVDRLGSVAVADGGPAVDD